MKFHVLEEDIDRILAGASRDEESAEVRAHIASCGKCQTQWSRILQAHDLLSDSPATPSTSLAARVEFLATQQWRRGSAIRWALRAAVLLGTLGLGAFLGRSFNARGSVTTEVPRYLFVFSGSQSQNMATEEIAAIGRAFRAWTDSLVSSGRVVAHGQLRRGTVGLVTEAEPSLDSATVHALSAMEGMLLVRAPHDSLALALARTCPFLRYGGTIVVRRLSGPPAGSRPGTGAGS